jgi:hypothetical protein
VWAFVWETVYLGVHEQNKAELFASENTCPSSLSPSLSLVLARIYSTPTETQIGPSAELRLAQPGQAPQGYAHLLRSHRSRRRSPLPCGQRRSSR